MNRKNDKAIRDKVEAFFSILTALDKPEETYDDDYELQPEKKKPYGRCLSIQMCLTAREKKEFEQVASEYIENASYHIPSKSALLRYLWRYFLKNRDDIDLSEYVD